ncbi:MAG: TIGR01777 family oxidoreductase [Bacteroidia bacterium]|nr:TIGR01777 family oxidoreductase [Bacteroidia bacterium]
MKIAIAGSTGFIGKQLVRYLKHNGHEVFAISRRDFEGSDNQLSKLINSAEVIINLAGSSVLCRWTKSNKEEIYSSRIFTTRKIVSALQQCETGKQPKLLVNASAVGIYDTVQIHDESSGAFDSSFLTSVCEAWEQVTQQLDHSKFRVCTIRIGIVLGTTGGTLKKLLPIFRLGLGGKIGSGNQPFPFIHVDDFCRGIDHLIFNQASSGVYNFVAPSLIPNKEFTKVLASGLNRPSFCTVPTFMLQLLYGEASRIITAGQRVTPSRLLAESFEFKFGDIETAIADLIR